MKLRLPVKKALHSTFQCFFNRVFPRRVTEGSQCPVLSSSLLCLCGQIVRLLRFESDSAIYYFSAREHSTLTSLSLYFPICKMGGWQDLLPKVAAIALVMLSQILLLSTSPRMWCGHPRQGQGQKGRALSSLILTSNDTSS